MGKYPIDLELSSSTFRDFRKPPPPLGTYPVMNHGLECVLQLLPELVALEDVDDAEED